ncbi:hypothetical protein LCGC14_2920530, partial [marine sediment metagenome]
VFGCGSHERFIPTRYKHADVEQRTELLRGLLDTDGECGAHGSIGYSTTSPQLAQDVLWLVRSLGGKASLQATTKHAWYHDDDRRRVPCRDCHRLTITLDWNPFTLKHRRERWHVPEARYLTRWIDRIEYSHDEEAMCITVAAPDGLYLTNDFIVTHNSTLAAWLIDWIMSTRPYCRGAITANTFTQLKTKTWAALHEWHALSLTKGRFTITSETMYRNGKDANGNDRKNTWFCAPQSSEEKNSEAFSGQHQRFSPSFYLFDEASSIGDEIWRVAYGGLTDGEAMMFVFGNPTRSQGAFHSACFGAMRKRWDSVSIDSRTCRFTNKVEIQEWEDDYGENSDFFRVRVRGLPPSASTLQFIDSQRVWDAQKRGVTPLPDEPLVV